MNAVDRRNSARLQLACDRFVRRQHELFDELMRFVILDPLQLHRLARVIQTHFYFGEIEVEGSVLKTFASQQ